MDSVIPGRRGRFSLGIAAAALALAACGGGSSATGTSGSTSLPPLSSRVIYDGVSFSVPKGFVLKQVGPTGSPTGGYMLKYPAGGHSGTCTGDKTWQATAVFLTPAQEIETVNTQWILSSPGGSVSIEVGPASKAGVGCTYASQPLLLPKQGIGATISGQGPDADLALSLARSIVGSAKPQSGAG